MKLKFSKSNLIQTISICLMACSPPAHAAVLNWDNGAANMQWNTTDTNWSGAIWSNATPDSAIFGATGAGTVNLTAPINANSLSFSAAGYTIAGNTMILAGTATITTTADATISTVLGGSAGLTKAGAGTLTLAGANNYTGVTAIKGGTLKLTSHTVGTGGGALTLSGGGKLELSGIPGFTNAAQPWGASAVAGSFHSAGFEAPKANDGNTTTRWAANGAGPFWIYADLGSVKNLSQVQVKWESSSTFKIQVSNNAVNWTDATASTAGSKNSTVTYALNPGTSGRYVKILATAYMSVYEMNAYGPYDVPLMSRGTTPSARWAAAMRRRWWSWSWLPGALATR